MPPPARCVQVRRGQGFCAEFPRRGTAFFSHLPCFMAASAAGMCRASDRIKPSASSATLMLLAPGAFMTTMPRPLAAAMSTLSTPVPARAITRKRGAAAMSSAVTLVALRTMSPSASARSPASWSGVRPLRASMSQPSAVSRSCAEAARPSAIIIFNGVSRNVKSVDRSVEKAASGYDFRKYNLGLPFSHVCGTECGPHHDGANR